MTQRKKNCWEFNGCRRAPGETGDGDFDPELCPAPVAVAFDGCNGGSNAGRACWLVAGTCCAHHGAFGSFATQLGDCHSCSFFQLVKREEGSNFVSCESLKQRLA